ncbi:MAG: IS982 family transposase [Bacteroidota bacterium]
MVPQDKISEIFYIIDEFCKEFENAKKEHLLKEDCRKKSRNRTFTLDDSEVITILILFHLGNFRCLKHYYIRYVQVHLKQEFPQTVSYNRFVELQQKAVIALCCFLKMACLGKCTGISFIDSTPIRVCHIKREKQNKVFKGIATKGQCSIGWFFGLKLHIVINDKGEIITFLLTSGNTDDREPLKNKRFHEKVFGKLFGDKGYIGHDLFEMLFVDGIHLITKLRKNMKNCLMHTSDKILLRKRALIETVNDQLKNICQIEHTRHRSFNNFIANLISGLIAYSYLEKKPSLKTDIVDQEKVKLIAA